MKPTDQAILGMVSESPGRNGSEPSGGLDKKINSGGRALKGGAKAAWTGCGLTETACHSGGVVRGSTVTRDMCMANSKRSFAARRKWTTIARDQ